MKRLNKNFYKRDALVIAPLLIGKFLVRNINGKIERHQITEVEVYKDEEDSASHARFGRTKRNDVMYQEGGITYVYLCYGIHYLLNIVTGLVDKPEGILIRGIENYIGPGKLTKKLNINNKLNRIDLTTSNELWIEDDGNTYEYYVTPRIGIDYATEPYKSIKWRYIKK